MSLLALYLHHTRPNNTSVNSTIRIQYILHMALKKAVHRRNKSRRRGVVAAHHEALDTGIPAALWLGDSHLREEATQLRV